MAVPTPDFDESMLTTRTLLYQITGALDLEMLAQTLPLVPMRFDRPWKRGTKPKVTSFPPFGCIYAIRYGAVCRGVWGPPFKNSVMVDISLGTKSINVKISKKSIHICGIRLQDEGLQIARLLCERAEAAHRSLLALRDHRALLPAAAAAARGGEVVLPRYVVRKVEYKEKMKLRRYEEGTETVTGTRPLDVPALAAATGAPIALAQWLADLLAPLDDMRDVDAYLTALGAALDAGRVLLADGALTLDPAPHHVMINCSYSLGFPIRKDVLKALIDERTDFVAHYDNAVDFYVNIEIVCTEEELENRRVLVSKKKALAVHTFIVYDSGHVMQSSKVFESMKAAFYRFRAVIAEYRPLIEDTTAVRLVAK